MMTTVTPRRAAESTPANASGRRTFSPWKAVKTAAMVWFASGHGGVDARRLSQAQAPEVDTFDALPLVQGKYLTFDNGTRFAPLLGFNKVDPRGCGVYGPAQVSPNDEQKLIDFAEDSMNFGLMRYALESDKATFTENQTVVTNKTYLNQIVDLVNYRWNTYKKPSIVSLWLDPSELTDGAPTNATGPTLEVLGEAAAQAGRHMMIGVSNEIHPSQPSLATDAAIRDRMQWAVDTVRSRSNDTIVVVAEPRYYNDFVSSVYEENPLVDSAHPDAPQILYSLHIYDGDWGSIANTLTAMNTSELPYIIEEAGPSGEVLEGQGPDTGTMTYPLLCQLANQVQEMGLPLLFWVLDPASCFPAMTHTLDGSAGNAATGITLNAYGQLVQNATRSGVCTYTPPVVPPLPPPPPPPLPPPHHHSTPINWAIIGSAIGAGVVASGVVVCLCMSRLSAAAGGLPG